MRKKTVRKVLIEKHGDFVESITDPKVKKLVEQNSIITGGSIASMLLGEKANDFDYYFTNKETVLAVVNYYLKDIENASAVEDEEDKSRIRIFIRSAGILDKKPEDKYKPIFITDNAISLSGDIQLIIRFYGSPEEIHENYDFVHCTNYWTSKDSKLVLNQPALECLLAKELKYQGSKYPICSIIRTRKFLQRDWRINAGQYLKMAFQISKLNLSDPKVLEDQLIGVDVAYFQIIINAFKDKKRDITEEYLSEIIDRVF
jgi:hypothetical protein